MAKHADAAVDAVTADDVPVDVLPDENEDIQGRNSDDESTSTDTDETSENQDSDATSNVARNRARRKLRLIIGGAVGVAAITACGAVGAWQGYGWEQARTTQAQQQMFLEVGKQGAVNLTTVDYAQADADVKRILDSATGTFHDDFQKRSQPFVDVVKSSQSVTVGRVTAAGLESFDDNQAQVLVAVSVKTSNAASKDQQPRAWRMRMTVDKADNSAKISNVQFVP